MACVCARARAFPGWRGWGFPRRAAGALCPPKCRRGAPHPRLALRPRGGARCPREGRQGRESSRRGPWLLSSAVGPLWEVPSRRKRSLGVPLGCRWAGTVPRPRGWGPRWWRGGAASVPPSFAARPWRRRRPGDGRPARLLHGALSRASGVCARPRRLASPRRVGAGGSGRGRVVRARPRPGDACPGGDPRDAAASPAAARFPPGCGRAALRARSRARGGRVWVGGPGCTASVARRGGGVPRLRGGRGVRRWRRERERVRRDALLRQREWWSSLLCLK